MSGTLDGVEGGAISVVGSLSSMSTIVQKLHWDAVHHCAPGVVHLISAGRYRLQALSWGLYKVGAQRLHILHALGQADQCSKHLIFCAFSGFSIEDLM